MSKDSKKYIYGNWKMAHLSAAVRHFYSQWQFQNAAVEVAVFPSFVHLPLSLHLVQQQSLAIKLGAQDCSTEAEGAFTGEVSAAQIRDLGADLVLIGHSERRQRGPETAQTLSSKLARAFASSLRVVFCIGETERERLEGKTLDVLKSQLEVIKPHQSQVLLAYEPVWAIGTGRVASVEDVREAHAFVWRECPQIQGLLYGGSVKPENSRELAQIQGVSGFLVGGASLKADSFLKIVESVL